LLSACAYRIPEVSPADIPRIEQAIAANPGDTDLQVRLGMAQYKAQSFDSALATIQHAIDAGNQSGAAYLYLGLTQEHFQQWAKARDAYNKYLSVGTSEPVKQELRKRLELIAQNVLKEQAKQALAQEARLSSEPPTPHSIAILPFGFNSDRQDLQPLVYALSDMMITDFSASNALTVLERAKIQTLLDEMSLTEAGYADPSTGARAGRLLQAANVVQGVITTVGNDNLRLDTDVLNTTSASSEGTESVQDQLSKLFDMEKELVFRTLRDVLHIQLTPAEEQAIRNNRADNMLAFLAYGRGLRDRDKGEYAAALQQFRQAQQLDPGFGAASDAVHSTGNMQDAAGGGTQAVTEVATGGGAVGPATSVTGGATGGANTTTQTLTGADAAVNPTPTSTTIDLGSTKAAGNTGSTQNENNRNDPTQDSQGNPGVTNTTNAVIRIVIKRPGGGEQ
jgi:tetratricopeptide (TPR) repeat protein